jgi:hypothetical protein
MRIFLIPSNSYSFDHFTELVKCEFEGYTEVKIINITKQVWIQGKSDIKIVNLLWGKGCKLFNYVVVAFWALLKLKRNDVVIFGQVNSKKLVRLIFTFAWSKPRFIYFQWARVNPESREKFGKVNIFTPRLMYKDIWVQSEVELTELRKYFKDDIEVNIKKIRYVWSDRILKIAEGKNKKDRIKNIVVLVNQKTAQHESVFIEELRSLLRELAALKMKVVVKTHPAHDDLIYENLLKEENFRKVSSSSYLDWINLLQWTDIVIGSYSSLLKDCLLSGTKIFGWHPYQAKHGFTDNYKSILGDYYFENTKELISNLVDLSTYDSRVFDRYSLEHGDI